MSAMTGLPPEIKTALGQSWKLLRCIEHGLRRIGGVAWFADDGRGDDDDR